MTSMLIEYISFMKAIHIIGFVAWFAGIFYLVRIFVYHEEAFDKSDIEKKILTQQYSLMEDRVYRIICNPAMMITWTFGILLILAYGMDWLKVNYWMHIKLVLLTVLTVYHLYCKGIMKKLASQKRPFNSMQYRLLNEVPTLLLFSIVFLAVYRNMLNFGKALACIIILGIFLYVFTKIYKRQRQKKL